MTKLTDCISVTFHRAREGCGSEQMSPKRHAARNGPSLKDTCSGEPDSPYQGTPSPHALASSSSLSALWPSGAATNTGYSHKLVLLFYFQATLQLQNAPLNLGDS